jgi:hypothetical protein
MRKLTLAVASFVAGVLCAVSLGNHASTNLQSVLAAQRKVFNNGNAVPVVPPISLTEGASRYKGFRFALDGVASSGSSFEDTTFVYGGGAYRLENASVIPPVKIELIGAAGNTATLLAQFGLIGCPSAPKPQPPIPNAPVLTNTNIKTVYMGT